MRWSVRVARSVVLAGVLVAVALTVAGTGSSAGPGQARWVITDLGSLGASFDVLAINDRGQVVGSRYGGDCGGQPFVWQQGRITVLTGYADCGVAEAIDGSGRVVGWHFTPSSAHAAFLWEKGKMKDLLGSADSGFSEASGINSRGQVIGTKAFWGEDDDPSTWEEPRAWLWQNGKMTDLGTLGGRSSIARAINDHSQVVGESKTKANGTHGFLWQNGKMIDLGQVRPIAINNRGQILLRPNAVWEKGKTIRLGRLDAAEINDHGQVVGYRTTTKGNTHAFLWEKGRMTDLGTLGGNESEAVSINEYNQIVGTSTTWNGQQHAVLWTLRLPCLWPWC